MLPFMIMSSHKNVSAVLASLSLKPIVRSNVQPAHEMAIFRRKLRVEASREALDEEYSTAQRGLWQARAAMAQPGASHDWDLLSEWTDAEFGIARLEVEREALRQEWLQMKRLLEKATRVVAINRYNMLDEEETEEELLPCYYCGSLGCANHDCECRDVFTVHVPKRVHERKDVGPILIGPMWFAEEPQKERDICLVNRLRARLNALKLCRSNFGTILNALVELNAPLVEDAVCYMQYSKRLEFYYKHYLYVYNMRTRLEWQRPVAVAEMDVNASDETPVIVDKASNVELISDSVPEVTKPVEISSDSMWSNFSTTHFSQDYSELVDRWIRVANLTWNSGDAPDTDLLANGLELPKDVIQDGDLKKCISYVLFSKFAYMRSDMEVKVTINSNPFQLGQLQLSFYYGDECDKYYENRNNIKSISQMTHVLIDAGASNDTVIQIPFRYYKPFVPLVSRDDDVVVGSVGRLRLKVLNQLRIPTGSVDGVNISVFVKFRNLVFSGMIDRNLADSEMLGVKKIVNSASDILDTVFPDPQRDNPTDIIPPKYLVPISAHSWAIGDKLPEPTNPLRLQATGVCPHPPGTLATVDEMSIDYVKSMFGLIERVRWDNTATEGTVLAQFPFSPYIGQREFLKISINNSKGRPVDTYAYPPVTVLSELFAYWRGSLDYRFDFIKNQYSTGRLIVAFVPRLNLKTVKTVDLSKIMSCQYSVIDVSNVKTYLYNQSYVCDKPWSGKRGSSAYNTDSRSPGTIIVAVLNKLVTMPQVASSIDFNVYIKGGSDLEFAVPTTPRIGLSFNVDKFVDESLYVQCEENYGPPSEPIMCDTWHTVGDNQLVFRYGPGSDHITQFAKKNFEYGKVYELMDDTIGIYYTHPEITAKYLVRFSTDPQPVDNGYVYGAPFSSLIMAKQFAASVLAWSSKKKAIDWSLMQKKETDAIVKSSSFDHKLLWREVKSTEAEGDTRSEERGVEFGAYGSLLSTQSGRLTFGEEFTNLRQLCRRYQPYGAMLINKKGVSTGQFADFAFPAMPQGLDLDVMLGRSEMPMANRCRDGVIPIISSAYRFYRGSLRFRIVIATKENAFVWVQHRPDVTMTNSVIRPMTNNSSMAAVLNHGYATLYQGTAVNGIVEFEVPCYLPSQFGMLQRPKLTKQTKVDSTCYSLGDVVVNVDIATTAGGTIERAYMSYVLYAHSDDMSYSIFQGFPPMLDLNIDNLAEAEMYSAYNYIKSKVASSVIDDAKLTVTNAVNSAVMNSDSSSDAFENSVEVQNLISKVCDSLPEKKDVMARVVSQLIHAFINPSWKTIAWSVVNCLVELGLFCSTLATKLVMNMISLIKNIWGHLNADKTNKAVGQIETDSCVKAAYMSTAVAGILSVLKISSDKTVGKIPDFTNLLWVNIPTFAKNGNILFRFFQNNLIFFQKVWNWVVRKIFPDHSLAYEIATCTQDVRYVVNKMQWCIDPENFDEMKTNVRANLLLYECANVAQQIIVDTITNGEKYSKMPLFVDMMKKVISVRDKMSRVMASPAIRFEPFVISLVGKSGLGKSHMTSTVIKHLFKRIGLKTFEELIYTKTPGNAYWNGMKAQPAILYDDFLQVTGEPYGLAEAGELFCLKSKAVFNPPMANIDDKELRINPIIVWLNQNVAFPVVNGVSCPEALYRRRDVMYEVEWTKEYASKKISDIPSDVRKTYKHMVFRRVRDTKKGDMINNLDSAIGFDKFLENMTEEFLSYYKSECINYQNAIDNLKEFYPSDEESQVLKLGQNCEYILKTKEFSDSRLSSDEMYEVSRWRSYLKHLSTNVANNQRLDKLYNKARKEFLCLPPEPAKEEKEDTRETTLAAMLYPEAECSKTQYQRSPSGGRTMCYAIAQMGQNSGGETEEHCGCCMTITSANDIEVDGIRKQLNYYETCFSEVLELPLGCADNCCVLADDWCEDLVNLVKNRPSIWTKWTPEHLKGPSLTFCEKVIKVYRDTTNKGETHVAQTDNVVKELNENTKSWWEKIKSGFFKNLPDSFSSVCWLFAKIGLILTLLKFVANSIISLIGIPSSFKQEVVTAKKRDVDSEAMKDEIAIKEKQILKAKEWAKAGPSDSQMPSSGTTMTAGARAMAKLSPKSIGAKAQMADCQRNVILEKIRRNTFWLVCSAGDTANNKTLKAKCIGLREHAFLMLDHYLYAFMSLPSDCTLRMVNEYIDLTLDKNALIKSLHVIAGGALFLGRLPSSTPMFPNIVKFIIDANSTGNLSGKGTLVDYKFDDATERFIFETTEVRFEREKSLIVSNPVGEVDTTFVNNIYSYPKHAPGMCGSILLHNINTPKPILGIHIAGTASLNMGHAEALVSETFSSLSSFFDHEDIRDEDFVVPYAVGEVAKIDNVEIVGRVDKQLAHNEAGKTRLVHTECFNKITQSTYDFPVLSPRDPRISGKPFSPMYVGCGYHGQNPLPMEEELLDKAYIDLRNKILANVIPSREKIGVLTIEQSVVGIPGLQGYDPMEMDTSEGFPFTSVRPVGEHNKKWLFDIEELQDSWRLKGLNPLIRDEIERKDDLRSRGIVPVTVFVDCLKDAKMPKRHVLTPGKTRIFSISPADFTVSLRQYFLDFTVAFQDARLVSGHAIGINVNSMEWTELVNKLTSKGQCLVVADYKKFGPTLMASCVERAIRIIVEWYIHYGDTSSENQRTRTIMGYELMHAYHLMFDTLYRVACGAPSGSPITTVLNSLVNLLYLRYMWQDAMRSQENFELLSLSEYERHVYEVTYGDDLILGVSEKAIAFFNCLTMSESMAKVGITLTDAAKSGKEVKYSALGDSETTFLKCAFKPHPYRKGVWLAPLALEAVEEICNWSWNTNKNQRENAKEACRSMLEQAFGHGPTYYESLRQKIIAYWLAQNDLVALPHWDELDKRIFLK